MSSVNKWGERRRTETAGREEDTQRKTKIIPFHQTQIIQQKMMSGWNNRVSCLSNFFCIFRISLKNIVYISLLYALRVFSHPKCYYGKMLLYYQVLNSRTQLKHLKQISWKHSYFSAPSLSFDGQFKVLFFPRWKRWIHNNKDREGKFFFFIF